MRMRLPEAILVYLIALSCAAWADDKQGQRNIYDVFHEVLKTSPNASVDEQVTAFIKRDMAQLLYPVDMTSFSPPDKDEKFRDLIGVLQKQMGTQATGILTADQFDRLGEASREIDAPLRVSPQGKIVFMTKDGSMVSAVGTGSMDDIAIPINKVHIVCLKREKSCEYREASLDRRPSMDMLNLDDLVYYDIKTWTPNRITAIREDRCITALMTIDLSAQEVTIASVPHTNLTDCRTRGPSSWKLVDGFPVAWKLQQDRLDKARKLVYPPAQRFMPNRQ
jgi:hypothetical protein